MSQSYNSMDIFKALPKTNCKECHSPTCLTFSVLAFKGERRLCDCPYLERDVAERFDEKNERHVSFNPNPDPEETLALLQENIASVDLSLSAPRLGGHFSGDTLTIKILGKDFRVDSTGRLSSDIHIHPWLAVPVLNYILNSSGLPVSGKWVPFRELEGGKNWYRLFGQRCENPLKTVADTYTDLFEDMMDIFNGRQVENHYESDISLVLYPLPKVPLLICYWRPEDGIESNLNLFFDSTAEENLKIESIYALATGIVAMLEKIALRHGY